SPAIVIPIAEETGLIVAIGDFVMRQACTDLQRWRAAGLTPAGVSVNLSRLEMRQPEFLTRVAETIESTGVRASDIQFEVTESAALDNLEITRNILASLRRLGCRIAVDDFGTGQSSLAHLKHLP